MEVTWTWTFPALDTAPAEDGLSDVVKAVHWQLTGAAEDGLALSAVGIAQLESPDVEQFKPFEQLTHDDVLSFVLSKIDQDEVKEGVLASMNQVRNPPIVRKMPPWVPPPVIEQPAPAFIPEPAPADDQPADQPA